MSKSCILIADDQADVRAALDLLPTDEGYAVETAASPAEVRAASAETLSSQ